MGKLIGSVLCLSPAELTHAIEVGKGRSAYALTNNCNPRNGQSVFDSEDHNIIGAIGEKAVATFFWLPWDGDVGRPGGLDVGGYQVRSTTYERGSMILHPEDKDEHIFILVIVDFVLTGRCRIVGWMRGSEGKQAKYWDATKPHPAYFIPQDELHSLPFIPRLPMRERDVE